MTTVPALATALMLLLGLQVAGLHMDPSPAQTLLYLAATVAGVLLARASGLTWADLGLARGALRRGVAYAVPCVVLVVAAYLVLLASPWTRDVLLDERYRQGAAQALYMALVVVLCTVVFEEVAFRGVLWGLLRRTWGPSRATGVSSALFGVWHVVPSLSFAGSNRAMSDRGIAVAGVMAGTVVLTAAAGVLLCELRRRSGSLVPAVALHWAVNGVGVLAAAAAWSMAPNG